MNPPTYEKYLYSVSIRSKGYIFKDYFLEIGKSSTLINAEFTIENLQSDLAYYIFIYLKHQYGEVNYHVGRTNKLILNYESIKNIFSELNVLSLDNKNFPIIIENFCPKNVSYTLIITYLQKFAEFSNDYIYYTHIYLFPWKDDKRDYKSEFYHKGVVIF